MIALDCASSEFYHDGKLTIQNSKEERSYPYFCRASSLFSRIDEKYPIISIEDGMEENDWEGWKNLNR